jgi:hypothetical protein
VDRARAQCAGWVAAGPEDVERLEADLAALKKQRRNLIRLAAHVGGGSEMPELVGQLNEVKERVRKAEQLLRATQSAAKAPETELAAFEAIIREDAARLRDVLSEPGTPGLRDALASLFPDGLLMAPAENENRRVWAISGVPTLDGSRLQSDPTGTLASRDPGLKPFQTVMCRRPLLEPRGPTSRSWFPDAPRATLGPTK